MKNSMKGSLLAAFMFICFYAPGVLAQGTNCANAITLPLDGSCNNYNTSGANGMTVHCNGAGYGGNGTVTYFRFTTNGTPQCVSLDITTVTAGTNLEAVLFSGCSGTTPTGGDAYQSICMDDGIGIWASNLWWSNLAPNTTYYLRVWTENDATLQICGKHQTPTNNLCSGATGIDDLTTPNQNNACNIGSTEVPPANLCAGSLENTAWYTFTVLSSGVSSIVISNLDCDNANFAGNNDYGFQIGFFTGNCGTLTPTNCIAQTGAAGGTVIASSTSLPAGTVVHVAIDGFAGSNCKYSITAINAAPLSVKMKSFEGWRAGEFNLLTWITTTEREHMYFEVERSSEGVSFFPIGRVSGAGNSTDERRYSFKDEKPLLEGYYRLKQMDVHNKVTYSRIIRIVRPAVSALTATFENPVHGILRMNLATSEAGMAGIRIVDASGRTILTENIMLLEGNNQYQHNLNKLTPGTYYLVVTKNETRKTFPFIKF
jgi:hypothetical protein